MKKETIPGRYLFDAAQDFNKFNGSKKGSFMEFAIWCLETEQGQIFVKKVVNDKERT